MPLWWLSRRASSYLSVSALGQFRWQADLGEGRLDDVGEVLVALVVNLRPHSRVQRQQDLVTLQLRCSDGDTDRAPSLGHHLPVLVGKVTALVENRKAHHVNLASMSRTCWASRIQREVIQHHGQSGSNQKSAVSVVLLEVALTKKLPISSCRSGHISSGTYSRSANNHEPQSFPRFPPPNHLPIAVVSKRNEYEGVVQ